MKGIHITRHHGESDRFVLYSVVMEKDTKRKEKLMVFEAQ